jgi:uncharacterized membrane protein
MPASAFASSHRFAPRTQRGAIALFAALFVFIAVLMLATIDIGHFFYKQRHLQKTADMAAIAGAQALGKANGEGAVSCADDVRPTALANAGANGLCESPDEQCQLDVTCGIWDAGTFTPKSSGTDLNAVQVVDTERVPSFLGDFVAAGFGATPHPSAIAMTDSPVAAFSVGSQLATLHDNGILPSALKLVGFDVDGTALVGYNGLANLRITPSGLLKALCATGGPCPAVTADIDVGTLNSILAANQISVGNLFDAVAYIGTQQQLASATIEALDALKVRVEAQSLGPIQLGSLSDGNPGLFAAISAANGRSALNVRLNALDLLVTGLEVANSRHFIDLSVGVPGVSAKLTLIEPPSIAIGGVGVTAYTGQVRLGLTIGTSAIPALGPLLEALGTRINLPLIVDVVTGKGTLTSLCDINDDGVRTATVDTRASLLNVCIGHMSDDAFGSTSARCDANLESEDLVTLLGIPVVSGKVFLAGFENQDDLMVPAGEIRSTWATLSIGDFVADLVPQVLNLILNGALSGGAAPDTTQAADSLWEQAGPQNNTPSGRRNRMNLIKGWLSPSISQQTAGLIPGLLNLVTNLLDSVTDLLGNVLGLVTGDGCTTGLLGLPGGSEAGCKRIIKNTLNHTQQTGGQSVPNSVIGPIAQILDLLRPVLNSVGEQLLGPLLKGILGDTPGRADVDMMGLQCSDARLVD